MKKLLVLLLPFMMYAIMPLADNYEISVTRKGRNIYKVDGRNIIIQTRYCYEYVYSENAFLRMNGYSGEMIFLNSGGKCDVAGVYGQIDPSSGKYLVTIYRVDDDWYEVLGKDIYIKTTGCLSLPVGEDAVLTISQGGYGTLHTGGQQCMVEGLYSKIYL